MTLSLSLPRCQHGCSPCIVMEQGQLFVVPGLLIGRSQCTGATDWLCCAYQYFKSALLPDARQSFIQYTRSSGSVARIRCYSSSVAPCRRSLVLRPLRHLGRGSQNPTYLSLKTSLKSENPFISWPIRNQCPDKWADETDWLHGFPVHY